MATPGTKHTFSVIGGDVVFTGTLSATVDMHLEGRIEGDITCANLIQGAASVIRGNVTAKSARIAGTVEGSISADELIVERGARIIGDSVYGTLSVEPGAHTDGRFTSREVQSAVGVPDLKVVAGGD